MNVDTNVTSGTSLLRMDAGIPIGSGMQNPSWLLFVMNLKVETERFGSGMVSND